MNRIGDKLLIVVGILGLLAAVYMLVSNMFYAKSFSIAAIIAGFISPLLIILTWNKDKGK